MDVRDIILTPLEANGFTINLFKCKWGVQETDWLGYCVTLKGLKPWQKKVDAILELQRPSSLKELRTFLGMVTYYCDLWPQRSHVLAGRFFPSWPSNGDYGHVGIIVLIFGTDVCTVRSHGRRGKRKKQELYSGYVSEY